MKKQTLEIIDEGGRGGGRGRGGGELLLDLYGKAVGHHHDDQWDEESHEGANQHEALLVEDTAAVDKDFVLIVETDDRDGHGDTSREKHALQLVCSTFLLTLLHN